MGCSRGRRDRNLPVGRATASTRPSLGPRLSKILTPGQGAKKKDKNERACPGINRYEIRWARLDPVEGSELGKTRPVVIISMDVLNNKLRTITICPVTKRLHPQWRTRLAIRCAGRPAEIAVDQIRTLAKQRLGPLLDKLSPTAAATLRQLIREMYAEP